MMKKYVVFVLSIWICVLTVLVSAEDWMPDPELRHIVKKKLGVPANIPLLPADMRRLGDLVYYKRNTISSLEGFEHAVNLEFLHIGGGNISDLMPLVGLEKLRVLKLEDNQISDISPLTGVVSLEFLDVSANNISDIPSLATLVNLKILSLELNTISDFRPLLELHPLEGLYIGYNPGSVAALSLGLNPTDFQICESPRTDVTLRVNSRDYPSVFAAWHNIINLPNIPGEKKLTYHDLFWSAPRFRESWAATPQGLRLVGAIDLHSKSLHEKSMSENPNMLTLVGIPYYSAHPEKYPKDWAYWLRDTSGNRVPEADWGTYLIDFTQPEAQQIPIDEAIAVAKCGLYDGIFLDWWSEEWNVLYNQGARNKIIYRPLEAEVEAKVLILRRIREVVGDDFLILVNTNRSKIPRSAPYVNGTFMETLPDHAGGYTAAGLAEIESTLLWSEENFRDPQINCLEGWATPKEPLDSPVNRRWMRVFTTMSLTHSDGYVSLASGIEGFALHAHSYEIWQGHSEEHARGEPHDHQHEHYWYSFYDADLGRPVSEKAKSYDNREGLFIREFTNGWAVYNRSGKQQTILLPEAVSGVASGVKDKRWHTLSDLDGEIYLKAAVSVEDVNSDGKVNILDLVMVANAIGKQSPDLNGDKVVNILDLVLVANAFTK